MSRLNRTFLGWSRPLLHLLRDHLRARHAADASTLARPHFAPAVADYSSVVVVLPGSRAGRRLIELLLEPAPRSSGGRAAPAAIIPPRVTTPHAMWDVLAAAVAAAPSAGRATASRPASALEERLAWVNALRSMPREELHDLVRSAPEPGELARWYALADLLARTRNDVAATGRRLADMPRLIGEYADEAEQRRWHAAARAEHRFQERLAAAGLADQAASRDALIRAVPLLPAASLPRVVIAGVVDLNADARRLVAALAGRCEVAVFAPPDMAAGFDDLGCVIPEWWSVRPIPIDESNIRVVHDRDDQAAAALHAVAELASGLPADQVTIAVPEPEVAEAILLHAVAEQERLSSLAAAPDAATTTDALVAPRFRLATGTPLAGTPLALFLAAAHEFITARSYDRFASLVRHADVTACIERAVAPEPDPSDPSSAPDASDSRERSGWLEVMDAYHSQHVHWIVNGDWHTPNPAERDVLTAVYRAIAELLGPLMKGEGAVRDVPEIEADLAEWCDQIIAMLARLTQHAADPSPLASAPESPASDAESAPAPDAHRELPDIAAVIETLRDAACTLLADVRMPARRALELVIRLLRDGAIADEAPDAAIELLGWLELAMDDARVMVVTGMNEGVIPGPPDVDPLLPNAVRAGLGAPTRESRFARDGWIASTIAASRPRTRFICARRGDRNEPRLPSRLLLATDPLTLARRLRDWGRPLAEPRPRLARVEVRSVAKAATGGPAHAPFEPIESMSVTAFRDYLASPRLFYLKHVLKLDDQEPDPAELDALHFGNLLHDVLRTMAATDVARTGNPDAVAAFLRATLESAASQRFGADPLPAVWLQLQQADARLAAFARWQVEWARAGWRIAYAEWRPPALKGKPWGASIVVDDVPMGLRGRVDRIDINDAEGKAVIFDYKSGDSPPSRDSIVTRRGEWLDLQLPLYRRLVADLPLPPDVSLAYFALPRDPTLIGPQVMEFSSDELADADEVAADVIRRVRNAEFDDLGPRPPTEGIFARICGTAGFADEGVDEEEDA